MYKFQTTWPYERVMGDIYFHMCPYCSAQDILVPMSKDEFQRGKEEVKTHAIMPCCHSKMTILNIDDDYFWTNDDLRGRSQDDK